MEDFIDRVEAWQSCGIVHPLTCGKNSNHELLRGEIRNDKQVLVCPTCKYVQKHVPKLPSREQINKSVEEYKNLWKQNENG